MEEIKEEDLSFESNYWSYQILYKGHKIGGAGSSPQTQRSEANRIFHRDMAKITIRDILNGRIAPFMRKNIEAIQEREAVSHS